MAAPEPSVAEPAAADAPLPDLLDLDLEALADVSHPVLAELVGDLRRRVADQASHGLWGFDNDSPPSPGRPPA
ncbi:FXSXX-COOH protein [Streptomyces sp. KK5PA1]|uniref:FXSXX-COOH protein n=1 Tax=Actinacidiphila acididurans TaxID=2784346 RepID=A0ABS2TJU3_9ACTN|nr:FXSXX-COOH protein [Actinacidiphila acididurans]